MFDENFLEKLPDDPNLAGKMMCDKFSETNRGFAADTMKIEHYNDFLRAFGTLKAFHELHDFEFEIPDLAGTEIYNITRIVEFFESASNVFDYKYTQTTIEKSVGRSREVFARKYGKTFLYEFSKSDLDKIQTSINKLRELITESDQIEDDHKARLLKRLEKLQSELHKKVSDIDRFWGLIGDAGVVIGKLGKDAKPFIDRIGEITKIVWRVQTAAEGLPSNTPMQLPVSKESKENK